MISGFNLETPYYYYDTNLLDSSLITAKKEADKYNFKIHYSIKANFNPRILNRVVNHQLGADCVSGNEIKAALSSGFNANDIVYAGVGKTPKEIRYAIESGIAYFNVESLQELELINYLASEYEREMNVSIRLNPNIDAKTHKYITTGTKINKFGISEDLFDELFSIIPNLKYVNVQGLHFHVGSQITDLNVFAELAQKVSFYIRVFEDCDVEISVINLGGGLGVDYDNPTENYMADFQNYFRLIHENLDIDNNKIEVHFELGRSLLAQCGNLVSSVVYIKETAQKNFAILDAGMTDLMRPALYQAKHKVEKYGVQSEGELIGEKVYDVVGPVCESSDSFGESISLPILNPGDKVVIRSAGAYGEAMVSNYNLRDKPESYFSEDFEQQECKTRFKCRAV